MSKKVKQILPLLWFSVVPILTSSSLTFLLYDEVQWGELTYFSLVIVYLIASFLMGLAMVPTTFMSFITGVIGGITYLPWMLISYTLASIIGYLIGQKTNQDLWLDLINSKEKGRQIMQRVNKKPGILTFSLRLSPILPFGLSNIALSILKVPIKDFLLWGTIGMIPRTVLSVWVGSQAINLTDAIIKGKELPLTQLAFLILVILSSIFLIRILFKKQMVE